MDKIIRGWITERLQQHEILLRIAVRQRAKFEGWLKFELAASAESHGAQSVEVESSFNRPNAGRERSDMRFSFNGVSYDVELKTPNSNWRIPGVLNRTRPITNNIAGIVSDAQKLYDCLGQGIVAFVLFPVPTDNRWSKYLSRISAELNVPLTSREHSNRLSIVLGDNQSADLVVCSFLAPHR